MPLGNQDSDPYQPGYNVRYSPATGVPIKSWDSVPAIKFVAVSWFPWRRPI
jgi:hypothetical protein